MLVSGKCALGMLIKSGNNRYRIQGWERRNNNFVAALINEMSIHFLSSSIMPSLQSGIIHVCNVIHKKQKQNDQLDLVDCQESNIRIRPSL